MSQTEKYVASSPLPVSVEEAFAYHERPGALSRLIPPWESVTIEHSDNSLQVGSRVVMKINVLGVPFRWVAEHTEYDPPHLFADTQISGPFADWTHRHEFDAAGDHSLLRDRIEYRVPLGPAGRLLGGGKARRVVESMFAFRHRLTRDDLRLYTDHPSDPLCVAVSGSTGLSGNQLCSLLTLFGHRVRPIVRSPSDDENKIAVWEDEREAAKLSEVDAVVHLAGEPIADHRWNDEIKERIRDSRWIKTRELCQALAKLPKKPRVLVCASASGYYGDRGDEMLDENSAPGDSFLASVAKGWEEACQPASEAGIRVVHARFGMILSPRGGALQSMLLPAKFGGGALGNGKQWWSWIALDDAVGAIYQAITDDSLRGPINFVSPEPITNHDFAKTLAAVLGRPALVPAPATLLRIALGEMADALLLASVRIEPRRLLEAGYRYRFTDLSEFLRYTLGRERLESAE